jgi:hypothetical protein
MRGFFDSKWREEFHEIIDSIKKERIFWNLMKGAYENVNLNVRGVFSLYFISLERRITVGDLMFWRADTVSDNLDKNIIKKKWGGFKNNEVLFHAIEEREKSIEDFFDKDSLIFTETEINNKFKERGYEELQQIRSLYFKLLDKQKTGMSIWKARKELQNKAIKLEFDLSGNHKVDNKILKSLKMSQVEIGEIVISLISEKIKNKETARKIEKSLREWEQLHMLQWCLLDHYAAWEGNLIKITLWRVVEYVFL